MLAYSGELGAAWAYIGHRKSLPPGPERQAIWQILKDEVRHRKVLLALMRRYGEEPDARAEAKLRGVGRFIAFICHVGGWFVPMLGAARLEASNIVEYEILARLAWWAGEPDDVPTHLHLGEVEWDHESVLRGFASRHPLCPRPRLAHRRPPQRLRTRTPTSSRTPNALASARASSSGEGARRARGFCWTTPNATHLPAELHCFVRGGFGGLAAHHVERLGAGPFRPRATYVATEAGDVASWRHVAGGEGAVGGHRGGPIDAPEAARQRVLQVRRQIGRVHAAQQDDLVLRRLDV
ncbi:MAG: ferritin-like domain-containing protein [Planctomycetota bacterium]